MNSDLMHPPGYGLAFYQCMAGENSEGGKGGLSVLPLRTKFNCAIILLQNWRIHQNLLKIMTPVSNSMVDFTNLPMFELKAQVPIRRRIPGNGQHARSLFVQPVADLSIRFERSGHGQNIIRLHPVFKRRDKRRLVDDDVVLVFKQDDTFEVDLISQRVLTGFRQLFSRIIMIPD